MEQPESLANQLSSLTRNFWLFFIFVTVLKIALAFFAPYVSDEAYYWVWSLHPATSYFDHPPMVSWVIWLNSWIFGSTSSMRYIFIIISQLTFLIWILLAKEFYPTKNLPQFSVIYLLCPLLGLGGLVAVPDVPFLFFWSLSFYALLKILKTPASPWWFAALGLFLGLCFLSKYMAVLFLIALACLLFFPEWRSSILRAPLFFTYLVGLLVCAPVIAWNSLHDWDSFLFQLNRGYRSTASTFIWSVEYVIATVLLASPFLYLKKYPRPQRSELILLIFAMIPFLFFFISSLRSAVEINWLVMSFPALFLFLSSALTMPRFFLHVLCFGFIHLLIIIAAIFPTQKLTLPKIDEMRMYQGLHSVPQEYLPLFASSYQMASQLWLASQVPVSKLRGMNRRDMFDYWEISKPSETPYYFLQKSDENWDLYFKDMTRKKIKDIPPHFILYEVTP